MPQDHHDRPDGVGSTTPRAADFDGPFWDAGAAAPDSGSRSRPVPRWWGWISRPSRSIRPQPGRRLVLTNFADLQDEARSRLSIADLCHRVTVIATAPG